VINIEGHPPQKNLNAGREVNLTAGADISLTGTNIEAGDRIKRDTRPKKIFNADNISLSSTADTTIKGANIKADDTLTVNVGDNLHVQSVQNRYSANNKSAGISAGFSLGAPETYSDGKGGTVDSQGRNMDSKTASGAANRLGKHNGEVSSVSGGLNASSGRTRTKQTVLTDLIGNTVNITTGEHTALIGATIAAKDADGTDNGQLSLNTKSFDFADLSNTSYDSQRSAGISANVGINDKPLTPNQKAAQIYDPTQNSAINAKGEKEGRLNAPSIAYSNNSIYAKSKTLATLGEGNVTIADDQASGEDSTERLNRDTDNTTKELYAIDRQQGNVDLTIDTRLLTEKGREEIAQDFKDTNEFGQDIGRAIETVSTEEAVKLVHFWKTLENNVNVTALKKIIRSNETLKAQLVSGNAEDLQAGTQQLIALAQGQLGLSPEEMSALFFYDASTVTAGSLADNNPFQDVKGATVLEGQYQGDIFVDVGQSATDGDILNTVGQEAYEGATLANGEANDATQEALSEAYGTQFTTRIGEAIKESGGGDVNTSYNTVNTLQGSSIAATGSTRATAVGNAAVDYRQVHRIEHGKISEMAANLSEKTGKDKAYWEDRLTSQLERRVNYEKKMDGIEEKSWDRESDNLLKSFINGNGDQFIVDEQGEYVLDPYGEKVPLFGNAANYQLENDTIFNDSAESNGEMPKLGWQEFKDYTASNISSTATNVASVPKDAVIGLYNLFTTNPLVTYEAMVEAVKNLPESQRQKALDFYTASVEHDYQKLGELQGEINSLAVAEVIVASIPGAAVKYLNGKSPRANLNTNTQANSGTRAGGADAEAGTTGLGVKEGFGVPKGISTRHELVDVPDINANRQSHVLDGQVGKNRKGQTIATGGHWLGSPNIQPVSGTAKNIGNGVISSQVRIKNFKTGEFVLKSNNGGRSTLFPANWNSKTVISEVSSANKNAVRVGNSNFYDGVSPSGVVVRFVKPNGNDAVTFYPRDPQ